MSRSVPFVVALSLLGCRTSNQDPVASSATLVASSDRQALYALNVDEGSIARLSLDGMKVQVTPAGSEPTRLTRAAGRVWVTLRGERSVVAYDEGPNGLVETMRAEVGAEPYGVVANADGTRIYVAVSLEDKVLELDGATLEQLREFAVLDEPRWLSLNRVETSLFVASAKDGRFTRIDLESGRTKDIRLPRTGTGHGPDQEDHGTTLATSTAGTGVEPNPNRGEIELDLVITGDPALSADGDTLAVPVVYADTTTPVVTAPPPGEELEGEEGGGGGGYASAGAGLGRFNASLVLIPLDRDGGIDGEMIPVFLGAPNGGRTLRSYPSGVASDPDGRYFVVSMEASNAALIVDTEPFRGQKADEPMRKTKNEVDVAPMMDGDPFGGFTPTGVGFWDRPVTAINTGHGPRGVAFVDNQLYVHAFVDRQIGWVDWDDAKEVNLHEARDRKADPDDQPAPVLDVRDHVLLEQSALPDEVRRGQRLFYSAVDRDITSPGGGVSCSTCHVDGRTDGRTWPFAGAIDLPVTLRQTPSLAGKASETAPFTWDGNVDSVADEAHETSTRRMGGRGLDKNQLLDLAAFVDSVRSPDTVGKGSTDAIVLEGKAIFERADVQCSTCHSGARFTNGENEEVRGELLNTPTLTGIAATGPYLHDGSARTLRDVLVWARSGEMGDTSMLDDHELDALEAYLRSL